MQDLLSYELTELGDGRFSLTYRTNKKNLDQLEDKLGFRILKLMDVHKHPFKFGGICAHW